MSPRPWQRHVWVGFALTAVALLGAAVFMLGSLRPPFEPGGENDLVVLFGLSTLIGIAFLVFSLVLTRSLVRLWAERRAGQLGSRFKTKLVLGAIGISLLPVRNLTVARGLPYGAAFPHASTLAVSLEIPVLGPAARALVDRERFSFADLANPAPPGSGVPARRRGELQAWLRRVRFQFREIELGLICEQILTALQ